MAIALGSSAAPSVGRLGTGFPDSMAIKMWQGVQRQDGMV